MASLSQRKLSRVVGGFKAFLKQAFAVAREQEALSLDDLALLERVADAVVKRGMAAPATVFLESVAPMNFLGSQALHFLTPILDLACKSSEIEHVAHLLERRDIVPRLIVLIEAKSDPLGFSAR